MLGRRGWVVSRGGADDRSVVIQRRVSAGSITSSISNHSAMLSALPCSYRRPTSSLEQRLARRVVGGGVELAPVAEAHGALEAHAAELPRRPGDARQRRLRAPAHHRLRAQPVRLAQHHRHHRHREVGARDEQPAAVPHERGGLDLGPDHHPRCVDERHDRQAVRVAELHEAGRLVGAVAVDRTGEV